MTTDKSTCERAELLSASEAILTAFSEGVVWNDEQRAAYTHFADIVGRARRAKLLDEIAEADAPYLEGDEAALPDPQIEQQGLEIARLKEALVGQADAHQRLVRSVLRAIETGRSEPLFIVKDQLRNYLEALQGEAGK